MRSNDVEVSFILYIIYLQATVGIEDLIASMASLDKVFKEASVKKVLCVRPSHGSLVSIQWWLCMPLGL